MAQTPRTYNEYTGNGTQVVFGFSFPYQAEDEVFVEVDGVSVPFTFDTTSTVRAAAAPATGSTVRVLRSTEADTMLYQFQYDAPFLPANVDANNEQILFALQETNDDLRDVDVRISEAVAAEASTRALEDAAIRAEYAAADAVLEAGYQAGDASLQAQISGLAPIASAERPIIQYHGQVIENSQTFPANQNAFSFGPILTIASGQEVTVPAGSYWTVANGQTVTQLGPSFDEGTL